MVEHADTLMQQLDAYRGKYIVYILHSVCVCVCVCVCVKPAHMYYIVKSFMHECLNNHLVSFKISEKPI